MIRQHLKSWSIWHTKTRLIIPTFHLPSINTSISCHSLVVSTASGQLPKGLCKERKDAYLCDYRKDADKTRKNHEAEVGYQENIRRSDELRCEINSTRNHDVKLMLALRCIELMTGEEGFERRNLNE